MGAGSLESPGMINCDDPPGPAAEPPAADIRCCAYFLWLAQGRPEGRDLEHWLAARQSLQQRRPARVQLVGPGRRNAGAQLRRLAKN